MDGIIFVRRIYLWSVQINYQRDSCILFDAMLVTNGSESADISYPDAWHLIPTNSIFGLHFWENLCLYISKTRFLTVSGFIRLLEKSLWTEMATGIWNYFDSLGPQWHIYVSLTFHVRSMWNQIMHFPYAPLRNTPFMYVTSLRLGKKALCYAPLCYQRVSILEYRIETEKIHIDTWWSK